MKKSKLLLLGSAVLALSLAVTPVMAATAKKVVKPIKASGVTAQTSIKVTFQNADMATSSLVTKEVICLKVASKTLMPINDVVKFYGDTVTYDKKVTVATIKHRTKTYPVKVAKVVNKVAYADITDYAKAFSCQFDATAKTLKAKKAIVYAQWSTMGHNSKNFIKDIVDGKTYLSATCLRCHNGNGFVKNTIATADIIQTADPSIGCSTCHSEQGDKYLESGSTDVGFNGYQITGAGQGALCASCHEGRKTPGNGKGPHGANQSDMLFGFGGYEYPGVSFASSPHAANPNTCVGCHMTKKDGVMSHDLKVDPVAACQICHAGLTTVNRTALSDFDGDKKIEGIQDEITGLLDVVQKAITDAGYTFTTSHGNIVFYDGVTKNDDGTLKAVTVDNKYYYAAWNYYSVQNDGSKGVHNPAYMVKLLQQSYKNITGNDVPNAVMR